MALIRNNFTRMKNPAGTPVFNTHWGENPDAEQSIETRALGRVKDFADRKGALHEEVARALDVGFDNAYAEYAGASGVWNSVALMNKDGDAANGLSFEYEGCAKPTAIAEMVPEIMKLVATIFVLGKCKSVRLFVARAGGQIVVHRDYLEFDRGIDRYHIPLVTSLGAFNGEGDHLFHLAEGGIFLVEGRVPHIGVNFNEAPRVHVGVDTAAGTPVEDVLVGPVADPDPLEFLHRPPLPAGFYETLAEAGASVTAVSVQEAFYLLNKTALCYQCNLADVYDWLDIMCQHSPDPLAVDEANTLRRKMIGA